MQKQPNSFWDQFNDIFGSNSDKRITFDNQHELENRETGNIREEQSENQENDNTSMIVNIYNSQTEDKTFNTMDQPP